jgi:hypothetical protein
LQNIITPPKYEKVYNSKEEYEEYLVDKQRHSEMFELDMLAPTEPEYIMQKVE